MCIGGRSLFYKPLKQRCRREIRKTVIADQIIEDLTEVNMILSYFLVELCMTAKIFLKYFDIGYKF